MRLGTSTLSRPEAALAGLKRLIDVFHLGQQRAQPLEQLFAVGGQPHLPRGAVQQAHAQLRFQLLHGGGHRGARHLQRMGCPDKAAHLRHLHEYAVLIESVHLVDLLFLGAFSDRECSRMARLRASRCGGICAPSNLFGGVAAVDQDGLAGYPPAIADRWRMNGTTSSISVKPVLLNGDSAAAVLW